MPADRYTKVILTIIAAPLVGLLSCAYTTWTHPTKNTQQYYEDESECRYREGQTPLAQRSRVYEYCMRGKGWYPHCDALIGCW